MHNGIFGWSYPPGCSGPPDDEGLCKICGEDMGNCICPECPECEGVGDPMCYIDHGLKRTWEQKFSLECSNRYWELENWKESLWYALINETHADFFPQDTQNFRKMYLNQPIKDNYAYQDNRN